MIGKDKVVQELVDVKHCQIVGRLVIKDKMETEQPNNCDAREVKENSVPSIVKREVKDMMYGVLKHSRGPS